MDAVAELAARLAIPGLPEWSGLLLLLLLALFVIAFLLMPFHVIGVKGRLDSVEARLDDIQAEIRALALRLPDAGRRSGGAGEDWADPPLRPAPPRDAVVRTTPPIPPPPARPERGRSEPRLR